MANNMYDIGDMVRVTATFTDSAGTVFDPDVIRIMFQEPDGTETTRTYALAEITKASTGVYYTDIDTGTAGVATGAGRWYYRCEGETSGGASRGANEATFVVRRSHF